MRSALALIAGDGVVVSGESGLGLFGLNRWELPISHIFSHDQTETPNSLMSAARLSNSTRCS